MRKSAWIAITGTLLSLPSMGVQARTPSYDALYVFGDSYCDVGNIFTATGGAEPAAPYYNGRFSNGPIWLDHVAGFLGVPLKASLLGGTDYAFGGAWATEPQSIPGGTIPSVPEQVGLYLSQHGGKADPNALYILEGGGNDILDTTTGSAETLGLHIAEGLAYSELLLRQAGARHFVIPDLFNVGLLPAAAGNVSLATTASAATDKALDELLAPEQLLEGVHIIRMNVFSLLNAIETDPTHFGFTNRS
jgi:phospholipase/lecithinase/hemolysin